MAEYRIVKDGAEIKVVKSLPAAKKAADSKGAEVFLGDKRVYTAPVKESEEKAQAVEPAEKAPIKEPAEKTPAAKKYRLKALMNVREKPNMSGRILSTMKTGTVVTVRGISDDWMEIEYGTGTAFVLFGTGKFAEELQ